MGRNLKQNPGGFRAWYWVLAPLAAFVAYLPVLRIGFLSDDYGFLFRAETRDLRGYLGTAIFLPSQGPGVAYYRPFGMLTTWQLDWQLWGLNPFSYHLLGLLLHCCTAFILGLCVSELVGKKRTGVLAGVLFGVFPIHTEAVGWVSSQWDVWAALFAITSLWLFSKWWHGGAGDSDGKAISPASRWFYWLAVLCYALAIFSKESALTWLVAPGLVPLFSMIGIGRGDLRKVVTKVVLALVPFGVALLAYLVIRIGYLGSFGGYANASSSVGMLGANLLGDLAVLLAPVNPAILGDFSKIVVGILSGVVIVGGLVVGWRGNLKAVAFWLLLLIVALVPVLSLAVNQADLESNRLLYLPAMGYCAVIVLLFSRVVQRIGEKWRIIAVGAFGGVTALFIVATWLHLGAWQTATRQADGIGAQLARVVMPSGEQDATTGSLWYVQSIPDSFQGAQVMRNGLDDLYHFLTGEQPPRLSPVADVRAVSIADNEKGTAAIRFAYDAATASFHIPYAMGQTIASTPPGASGDGWVWDFTSCSREVLSQWGVGEDSSECGVGSGLSIGEQTGITSLSLDAPTEPVAVGRGTYLRLSIAVEYPVLDGGTPAEVGGSVSRLFWSNSEGASQWTDDHSAEFDLVRDGVAHVYWMVIDGTEQEDVVAGLRYDTAEGIGQPALVKWVAVERIR